jgi:hypothetical protein
MKDELTRAQECRRIAEQCAATPIARENWLYLAAHWEKAARREPEPNRKFERHWQVEPESFSSGVYSMEPVEFWGRRAAE